MADVVKGGAFAVMASENSTATDHPEGTCVPAKGEGVVCAEQMTETAEGAENQTEAEAGDDAADGTQTETEGGNGAGKIKLKLKMETEQEKVQTMKMEIKKMATVKAKITQLRC